jgi:linoleoyl-CoA desaturase
MVMQVLSVKFANDKGMDYIQQLRLRVDEYFNSRKLSKKANTGMVFKSVFMLALYFVPYFLSLSGLIVNPWGIWILWVVMGLGMSGIGLSVMHDANHGAYSSKPWLNTMLGYFLNLIGGSCVNWRMQHNVLHHSYTNIDGLDEDISITKILRFSPHQPWKKMHRYQHLYAWFLYSLMTIDWILFSDFAQLSRYHKKGLTKGQNRSYRALVIELIISKVIYAGYVIIIPLLLLDIAWWQYLLCFLSMQLVCGFILAVIFQPAHVVPTSEYPMPDPAGKIENSWAVHQMLTTSDFAPKSLLFSWFVGGLNFQVEHHLFPNVCHVHYKKLSHIVRKTAEEFGIPHYSQRTYLGALLEHARMLRSLGRQPSPAGLA